MSDVSSWQDNGVVQYPMCQARLGADSGVGYVVPGLTAFRVEQTNHYQAARFHATFRLAWDQGFDAAWWGTDTGSPWTFSIEAAFATSQAQPSWTRLILGDADTVTLYPDEAKVVVEGRDLAARLIDSRTKSAYRNQTASEIVAAVASEHGIKTSITPTSTPAYRYFQQDHEITASGSIGQNGSEWDLISTLASFENFNLWVDENGVLNFHPFSDATGIKHHINWTPQGQSPFPVANAWGFQLERSTTLAKDVEVLVESFHQRQGKVISATSYSLRRRRKPGIGRTHGGAGAGAVQSGRVQRWVYRVPNLTADQAKALAEQLRRKISEHERVVTFTRTADLTTTPRDTLQISGFGGTWDDHYFIAEITRKMDQHGFTMEGKAKNHPASSDPTAM